MRRTVGAVLLTLAIGVAAAGCAHKGQRPGIATAGSGATPSASASVDREAAMRQYAQCMRDHGVDVPDPDNAGDPNGGSVRITTSESEKTGRAMEACRNLLPEGKMATPDAQQIEQLRQFAQCMREHGIDMPDPDPNGGGLRIQKGSGGNGASAKFNPDDPVFKAAADACKDKLPGKVGVTK